MKTKKFALLIILSMLVTGFAGADSYIVEDDIYYNPNDKNPVVEKKEKEAQKELQEKAAVKKTLMATSDNHFRDVDEYNRRGESSDMTLEDIAANQKEDYVEYNVVDENGDDGYYLNGFNGSDSDYEYALRIRRFHNPKFVVSVSDPFYSDIYFLDNNDWNVYISDNYAWVTPTWTNPWYWNYTWAPYSYTSWSWRWSLGPWGFSFGYDPFYSWGGYWGWNSWYRPPFYHHHHHHYYDRPYYGWNRPYRPQYTPNGRTPNRYGGSAISSGNSAASSRRRATVGTGTSGNTTGRRTVGNVTSTSGGHGSQSVNGVRTNRGTVISNSSNSNGNRGYSFGEANFSRRGNSSFSGTVSNPSSSQSRRQTTINNNTNSSRRNYNSIGNGGRGSSSYNRSTPSSNRNSGYSNSSSSSRRSSGSYSAPSHSSSSRGSGTSSRGSSSSGRGGRR